MRASMAERHKQGTKERDWEFWKSCSVSKGEQSRQSKFFKAALALVEHQNKWAHFHF